MMGKTWPALKSCKHQCYEGNDQLNHLPNDILLLIMSFLTTKEAARTSVLSHKWNHLWRCFPVLIFKNDSAMKRMIAKDNEYILQERSSFLRWVNQVVDAHLGWTIDELRVAFDFDNRCQSHMDKWVVFALSKQVKKLELDFTPPLPGMCNSSPPQWQMSIYQPHNPSVFKSSLCSLCLKYVDITTEDVDCVLGSCMVLENLCIDLSRSLRYVRACGSPLYLKHLQVSYCPQLRMIDILAPKLLSFIHTGDPIELHIRNASLLLEVSVGYKECRGDVVAYAFDSLSKYFSQLQYLSWQLPLYVGHSYNYVKFNSGINNPPAMTNLKHLELDVEGMCQQSLLGWTDLIEASPLLQRLTVKISLAHGRRHGMIVKHSGRPLGSLKTLELCGDLGYPIDLEFATYVIENSIMLKDVIVDFRPFLRYLYKLEPILSMQKHVAELKRIAPQGCKLRPKYRGSTRKYLERTTIMI